MTILLLGSVFTLVLYCILVTLALIGWRKGSSLNSTHINNTEGYFTGVTVIIPFHNEAEHLPALLIKLTQLQSSNFDIEYLFVNDNSSDNWACLFNEFATELDIRCIDSPKRGKKNAIYHGVQHSKFNAILTTDADCLPSIEWIDVMANTYRTRRCDMLFGPVALIGDNSLFSYFQSTDYAAMAAIGGGVANIGLPFICSGANLMFSKESYLNVFKMIRFEYASGDDVFLLHAFKQMRYRIHFCQSSKALVQSSTEKSFIDLVNQRVRWGAKAKGYRDIFSIAVTLTVFTLSFTICCAFVLSIIDSRFWILIWALYFVKTGVDFLFLSKTLPFFRIKPKWIRLLAIQITYPFWIIFIALQGLVSNSAWKYRKKQLHHPQLFIS